MLLCTSLFQITYIALVHCVCGQYKDKLEIDHHHHHHINRSIIKTFHENEKWNERIFSFRNSFFFLFIGVERFQTIFRQLEWWLCEDRTLNILDWMSCVTYDDFFYSFIVRVCVHYYKTSLYNLHNHHQHHFVIVGIHLWSLSSPLIINWCQIWLHNTDVKSIQMTESHLSYLRILSSAICLEIIFFKKIEKNKSKRKKQTAPICSF